MMPQRLLLDVQRHGQKTDDREHNAAFAEVVRAAKAWTTGDENLRRDILAKRHAKMAKMDPSHGKWHRYEALRRNVGHMEAFRLDQMYQSYRRWLARSDASEASGPRSMHTAAASKLAS